MSFGPTLSIVTVAYNDLDALRMTVESVIQIDFHDLEYIIIDGGSTDGSKEYLESLSIPYLNWISESDEGIFDAFNKGIRLASGAWVHLLNAGDFYSAAEVFSAINFSEEYDFICFSVLKKKKKDYVWVPKIEHNPSFVNVAHPGLVVRRDFYLAVAMYSVRFKFVSDSHFIWRYVSPENSEIYDIVLVEMADGGYSTRWSFEHELEKHKLIASSEIGVFSKVRLHFKYFIAGVYKWLFR